MANIFHSISFIICVILIQTIWTSATPLDQNNACSQPIQTGRCLADFPSFGFDSEQQKCVEFTYGGCDGNKNRFDNLEDCQAACEACSQPIYNGPCYASVHRFAFDSNERKCVQFLYGGCYGNKNNFETLAHCQATCA